jgi:hypothetical protein
MGYGILNLYKSYQTYLGINDIEKSKIKIYPNPAKDFINITSEKPVRSIEIYDTLGKIN